MKYYKKHSLPIAVVRSFLMTRKQRFSQAIIALMASFLLAPSMADEVSELDKDHYVINSCHAFKTNRDNAKTLPCSIYIRGFFYGVLSTNNSDFLKMEDANNKTSTLVERAYANRVGKRGERKSLNYSCLTVDQLKVRIFDNLSNHSRNPFESIEQLNAFLIKNLVSACSVTNNND